jgi:hypothetical protein
VVRIAHEATDGRPDDVPEPRKNYDLFIISEDDPWQNYPGGFLKVGDRRPMRMGNGSYDALEALRKCRLTDYYGTFF